MKDYYFGNLTEDRVTFCGGRDLELIPKQDGDPLNFFIYPYVEVDGKKYAADKVKRLHLELGGKAPVVVFDDADLEAVIDNLKTFGYWNSGQDCTAPCRVIAGPKIYDRFVADLAGAHRVVVEERAVHRVAQRGRFEVRAGGRGQFGEHVPQLPHGRSGRLDDLRVQLCGRRAAGRAHVNLARASFVEQAGRHLAPAGVMNADEENLGNVHD